MNRGSPYADATLWTKPVVAVICMCLAEVGGKLNELFGESFAHDERDNGETS